MSQLLHPKSYMFSTVDILKHPCPYTMFRYMYNDDFQDYSNTLP